VTPQVAAAFLRGGIVTKKYVAVLASVAQNARNGIGCQHWRLRDRMPDCSLQMFPRPISTIRAVCAWFFIGGAVSGENSGTGLSEILHITDGVFSLLA
jgi:hypothetical protein